MNRFFFVLKEQNNRGNLRNSEWSQQDHQSEESARNWKFTGIVSFFTSSFVSHPFSYNMETVHKKKQRVNALLMHRQLNHEQHFWQLDHPFIKKQSNADRDWTKKEDMVGLGIVKLQPLREIKCFELQMSNSNVKFFSYPLSDDLVNGCVLLYKSTQSNLYVHAKCTCKILNTEQKKRQNQVAAL